MASPSPHPLPLPNLLPPSPVPAPPPPAITMKASKKTQGPLSARGSRQKTQGPLASRGASQKMQGPLSSKGFSQVSQKNQGQVVKNKDRVFKQSKRPSTAVIPEYTVYRPNVAECVKRSCPNPVDVFLLMYPPTLREITVERSDLYSTQTKGKQLNLSMDELLTFYGILIASGYSSVPRRHMYWSVDNDVHNESILQCGETALMI